MVYKVGLPKSRKLMDQRIQEIKEAAERIRRLEEQKYGKKDEGEGCKDVF